VARLKEQPSCSLAGGSGDGLPDVPAYLADLESAGLDEDLGRAFRQHQEGLVEERNAALARIEAGTFGRCEECQRPIAGGRPQVFPYARGCLPCARRREGGPEP
jgi:RNA polymerase-binding transcription factor DksA